MVNSRISGFRRCVERARIDRALTDGDRPRDPAARTVLPLTYCTIAIGRFARIYEHLRFRLIARASAAQMRRTTPEFPEDQLDTSHGCAVPCLVGVSTNPSRIDFASGLLRWIYTRCAHELALILEFPLNPPQLHRTFEIEPTSEIKMCNVVIACCLVYTNRQILYIKYYI